MRLIPVIDLKGGRVVRGIAGRREEYHPWVSPLTPDADPLGLARTFRDRFGLRTLYLADLDAIAGAPPACELFARLRDEGLELWVDAGLRRADDAIPLAEAGVDRLIAGLESLDGPDTLGALVNHYSAARVIFSLDHKAGLVIAGAPWPAESPVDYARLAASQGVRSIVVLDLTCVGTGGGLSVDCMAMAKVLQHDVPGLELTLGGGVRDRCDVDLCRKMGVDNVLVASALHDGRLGAGDVKTFRDA